MAAWQFQRLSRSHDRAAFDCGQSVLNEWLKHRATQWDRKDLARTYVAVRPGETTVLGYYALANHRVTFEALPHDQAKGLPRIDVPVVLLGRLAVDQTVQGEGLGGLLLVDALRRALHISEQIGVRAVEVHAIGEAARRFYLKYGFVPLKDDEQHLFLSMHALRKLKLAPLPGR